MEVIIVLLDDSPGEPGLFLPPTASNGQSRHQEGIRFGTNNITNWESTKRPPIKANIKVKMSCIFFQPLCYLIRTLSKPPAYLFLDYNPEKFGFGAEHFVDEILLEVGYGMSVPGVLWV